MLNIKCAGCKQKVFKYHKIGKGRVLVCWLDKIHRDYSVKDGNFVKCKCGNLIGVLEGKGIKMKQNSFVYSGTKVKK